MPVGNTNKSNKQGGSGWGAGGGWGKGLMGWSKNSSVAQEPTPTPNSTDIGSSEKRDIKDDGHEDERKGRSSGTEMLGSSVISSKVQSPQPLPANHLDDDDDGDNDTQENVATIEQHKRNEEQRRRNILLRKNAISSSASVSSSSSRSRSSRSISRRSTSNRSSHSSSSRRKQGPKIRKQEFKKEELLFEMEMKTKRIIKISMDDQELLDWFQQDLRQRHFESKNYNDDDDHHSDSGEQQQRLPPFLNDDEEYALELFDEQIKNNNDDNENDENDDENDDGRYRSLTNSQIEELIQMALIREKEVEEEEELFQLLNLQEGGQTTEDDEDRIYYLELLIKSRKGEPLTLEEEEDLRVLEEQQEQQSSSKNDDDEGDEDLNELNELLDLKDAGEIVDEDRVHELELLIRKREGEDLSREEQRDLNFYKRKHQVMDADCDEFDQLVLAKQNGDEDVDEDRLFILELVMMDQNNEELTEEEAELLEDYMVQRDKEILEAVDMDELEDLLERKNRGDDNVDEDRIFQLQQSLDDDDDDDADGDLEHGDDENEELSTPIIEETGLEVESKAKENDDDDGKIADDNDAKSDKGNLTEEEMDDNFDTESGHSRLRQELEKQGLPMLIKIGDNKEDFHNSRSSFRSVGDDSYVQDLLSQKDRREQDRREETLEDALELYQIALQEKNLPEDEQLFVEIYEDLLKENIEKFKEADRIHDERIEKELKLQSVRKQEREKEKQQEARRRAEEEARRKRESDQPVSISKLAVERDSDLADSIDATAKQEVEKEADKPESSEASEQKSNRGWGLNFFGKQNTAAAEAKRKAEIEAAERAAQEAMQILSTEEAKNNSPSTEFEAQNLVTKTQSSPDVNDATQMDSDAPDAESENATKQDLIPPMLLPAVSISAIDDLDELPERWKSPDKQDKNGVLDVLVSNKQMITPIELFGEGDADSNPKDSGSAGKTPPKPKADPSTVFKDDGNLRSPLLDAVLIVDAANTSDYARSNLRPDTAGNKPAGESSSTDKDHGDKGPNVEPKNIDQLSKLPTLLPQDGVQSESGLDSIRKQAYSQEIDESPDGSIAEGLDEFDESPDGSIAVGLASLLDLRSKGISLSESQEDLYYQLDVLSRMNRGEDLSPTELEDAKFFKKQRANIYKWQREYEEMLDMQDAGGEVDQDRYYFLELVDKRRLNESMTESELDDLEMFEEEELAAASLSSADVASTLSSSLTGPVDGNGDKEGVKQYTDVEDEVNDIGSAEEASPAADDSPENLVEIETDCPASDPPPSDEVNDADTGFECVEADADLLFHNRFAGASENEGTDLGQVPGPGDEVDAQAEGSDEAVVAEPTTPDAEPEFSASVRIAHAANNDSYADGIVATIVGQQTSTASHTPILASRVSSAVDRSEDEGANVESLSRSDAISETQEDIQLHMDPQVSGSDKGAFSFVGTVEQDGKDQEDGYPDQHQGDITDAVMAGHTNEAMDCHVPIDHDEDTGKENTGYEDGSSSSDTADEAEGGFEIEKEVASSGHGGAPRRKSVLLLGGPGAFGLDFDDMDVGDSADEETDRGGPTEGGLADQSRESQEGGTDRGGNDSGGPSHCPLVGGFAAAAYEAARAHHYANLGRQQGMKNTCNPIAQVNHDPTPSPIGSDIENDDLKSLGQSLDGSVEKELNSLLKLKAQAVDLSQSQEDLYYELDVISRLNRGDDLSPSELQDAKYFKRQRANVSRWQKEYEEMLDIQDAGGQVDQDRFYFLELVDKRRLDESMTESELDDLDRFEEEQEEAEANAQSLPSSTFSSVPGSNARVEQHMDVGIDGDSANGASSVAVSSEQSQESQRDANMGLDRLDQECSVSGGIGLDHVKIDFGVTFDLYTSEDEDQDAHPEQNCQIQGRSRVEDRVVDATNPDQELPIGGTNTVAEVDAACDDENEENTLGSKIPGLDAGSAQPNTTEVEVVCDDGEESSSMGPVISRQGPYVRGSGTSSEEGSEEDSDSASPAQAVATVPTSTGTNNEDEPLDVTLVQSLDAKGLDSAEDVASVGTGALPGKGRVAGFSVYDTVRHTGEEDSSFEQALIAIDKAEDAEVQVLDDISIDAKQIIDDSDNIAIPDQPIAKWVDRDKDIPEDLVKACRLMIPRVYKDQHLDMDRMLQRTPALELYRYLSQQLEYEDIHADDGITTAVGDPGYVVQSKFVGDGGNESTTDAIASFGLDLNSRSHTPIGEALEAKLASQPERVLEEALDLASGDACAPVSSGSDARSSGGSIEEELASLLELKSQGVTLNDAQEDLYYELNLLAREKQGEELSPWELEDANCFKDRRSRLSKWQREYEEMIGIEEAGGQVDPDRLYFLELVDKRRLDESLTESELDDLEAFEENETVADEEFSTSIGADPASWAKATDMIVGSVAEETKPSLDVHATNEDDPVHGCSEKVNASLPEQKVAKWVDRENNIPEDLDAACRLMIPRVYKAHDVDVDRMLQRTPPLELYKYLVQQLEYEDLHAGENLYESIGDPGHSMQADSLDISEMVEGGPWGQEGLHHNQEDVEGAVDIAQPSQSDDDDGGRPLVSDGEAISEEVSELSSWRVQADPFFADSSAIEATSEPSSTLDIRDRVSKVLDITDSDAEADIVKPNSDNRSTTIASWPLSANRDRDLGIASEDKGQKKVGDASIGSTTSQNNEEPDAIRDQQKNESAVPRNSFETTGDDACGSRVPSNDDDDQESLSQSLDGSVEKELNSLLKLKAQAVDLSQSQEDLYYELDVISRLNRGDDLSPSELQDAKYFKRQRANVSRWQKEYEEMLDIQDAGGQVDQDRFYFLELVDKRRLDESMTESELDDLDRFEEEQEEEEEEEEDDDGHKDTEAASTSGTAGGNDKASDSEKFLSPNTTLVAETNKHLAYDHEGPVHDPVHQSDTEASFSTGICAGDGSDTSKVNSGFLSRIDTVDDQEGDGIDLERAQDSNDGSGNVGDISEPTTLRRESTEAGEHSDKDPNLSSPVSVPASAQAPLHRLHSDNNSVQVTLGGSVEKELNSLLKLKAQAVDLSQSQEDLYYELDVISRLNRGDDLSPSELQDAKYFKRQRDNVSRWQKEYEEMLDIQDAGGEVDQDRFYFLELVDKRRLNESMTESELDDLNRFEEEEDNNEAAALFIPGSTYGVKRNESVEHVECPQVVVDTDDGMMFAAGAHKDSLRDNADGVKEEEEVEAAAIPIPGSAHGRNRNQTVDHRIDRQAEDDDVSGVIDIALSAEDSPPIPISKSSCSDDDDDEQEGRSESVRHMSQAPGNSLLECDSIYSGVDEGSDANLHLASSSNAVQVSTDRSSSLPFGSDHDPVAYARSHAVSLLSSLDETLGASSLGDSFYVVDMQDEQLVSNSKSGVDNIDTETSDEMKTPTEIGEAPESEQLELEELDALLDLAERGDEFDEERLYELELRARQRSGEQLSEQEALDLVFFDNQRERDRRYEKELIDLLSKQEEGIEVDEERLYFLELLDKQRNGELLYEEDLKDLELLQTEEDARIAERNGSDIVEDIQLGTGVVDFSDAGMEARIDQTQAEDRLEESSLAAGDHHQAYGEEVDLIPREETAAFEEAAKLEQARVKDLEMEGRRRADVEKARLKVKDAEAALKSSEAAAKRAAAEEEEIQKKAEASTMEAELKRKIAEEEAKRKASGGWGRLFSGREADEEKRKAEAEKEARQVQEENERMTIEAEATRKEAENIVENKRLVVLKSKAQLVEAESKLRVAQEDTKRTRHAVDAANRALEKAQFAGVEEAKKTKVVEKQDLKPESLLQAEKENAHSISVNETESQAAGSIKDAVVLVAEEEEEAAAEKGVKNDSVIDVETQFSVDDEKEGQHTLGTRRARSQLRHLDSKDPVVDARVEDQSIRPPSESEVRSSEAAREKKQDFGRVSREKGIILANTDTGETTTDAVSDSVSKKVIEHSPGLEGDKEPVQKRNDKMQRDTAINDSSSTVSDQAHGMLTLKVELSPAEMNASRKEEPGAKEGLAKDEGSAGSDMSIDNQDDKRAEMHEAFRLEYEELLDALESGDGVDENRLYFLELFDRREEGEFLTDEELLDLEDFEAEEFVRDEKDMDSIAARQAREQEPSTSGDMVGSTEEGCNASVSSIFEKQPSSVVEDESVYVRVQDLSLNETNEIGPHNDSWEDIGTSNAILSLQTVDGNSIESGGKGDSLSISVDNDASVKRSINVSENKSGEATDISVASKSLKQTNGITEDEKAKSKEDEVNLPALCDKRDIYEGKEVMSPRSDSSHSGGNVVEGEHTQAGKEFLPESPANLACDEDQLYYADLEKKEEEDYKMDNDEKAEFEFIGRLLNGDQLDKDEAQELDLLRMTRRERQADKKELDSLQRKRERGEDYDEQLLYELELFENDRQGETLDDDQLYELELFERRKAGDKLSEVEEEDLRLLRQQRDEQRLDEADLRDLRGRKQKGEKVDEEFLHELEIFEKKRLGSALNDDEMFEFDLFERRRLGEVLHEDEVAELEHLSRLRQEARLDEEELNDLRRRKSDGELVDEDWLYELQLYHKRRSGIELDANEKFEIALFERRRDGVELNEDELDELDMLKRQRLEKAGLILSSVDTMIEDDSAYLRMLLAKSGRGEDLTNDEITEFQLLDRKLHGEVLHEDELDELEILRRRRIDRAAQTKSKSATGTENEKKKKTSKKVKKPKKEKKPKEKKMRRKRRKVKVKKLNKEATQDATQEMTSDANDTSLTPTVSVPSPAAMPPKDNEPRKSVFGGLFGRQNNKKEQELEEQRRRQEELIREQLKAMELDNELHELEKEKERQEKLVKESIEQKFEYVSESESYSSLETDPEWVDEDSESEASGESQDTESEGSGDDTLNASIGGGDSTIRDSPGQTNEDTDDVVTVPVSPPNLKSQGRRPRRPRPPGVARRYGERRGESLSVNTESQSKPPVDMLETGPSEQDHDDVSVSSEASEPTVVSTDAPPSPEKLPNLARNLARARARRSNPRRSKSVLLEEHLEKQKKQASSAQVNKHGDEISLGTLERKKRRGKKRIGTGEYDAVQDSRGSKHERPWKSGRAQMVHTQPTLGAIAENVAAIARGKMGESMSDFDKEVFNRSVFNRSVFNLSHSFASKMDLEADDESGESDDENETVTDTVVSAVVQKEEENAAEAELQEQNDGVEMLDDTYSTLNFDEPGFGLGLLDYEELESKLAEKLKNKDSEFDQKWEEIEADKAVAAQMSRRRQDRQRKQTNGKKEKEEEGIDDIPRLFLFEGEKLDSTKKKRRRKKSKKQRKLDHKLSKEFRKAMKEIFESDSEESYDKTFGEGGDGQSRSRRFSMAESSDTASIMSGSSKNSEEISEGIEDDYFKRLRAKSMQKEVKEMLHGSQSSGLSKKSDVSDEQSVASNRSEMSRNQSRKDLRAGSQSDLSQPRRKRRKGRVRRNRSGELVGPHIDPADVYAQEVEKTKARTTFSIAELRKEMEDMKQTSFGVFEPTPAAKAKSFNNNPGVTQTPAPAKQKKGFLQRLTKTTPNRSPGPETLSTMNPDVVRPAAEIRQISFSTLNSANRAGFDIGGNLAAPPAIDEGDEEALFGNTNSPGADFDNSLRSRSVRPSLVAAASTLFKSGGFASPRKAAKGVMRTPGGQRRPSVFSRGTPGAAGLASGPLPGGSLPTGPLPSGPVPSGPLATDAGGLGGTGFQEPLPLPEMQDDPQRKKGFGLGKFAGKMKKMTPKMNFGRKNQGQELGGALGDDDSDDGGMGLLG